MVVDLLDPLDGFCYFIIGQLDEFGVSALSQSGLFGFLTSGELALAATTSSDCWPLQLCYRTRWLCPVGGPSWQYQQFCHWTHPSARQWIFWSRTTRRQFLVDLRTTLGLVSMDTWYGGADVTMWYWCVLAVADFVLDSGGFNWDTIGWFWAPPGQFECISAILDGFVPFKVWFDYSHALDTLFCCFSINHFVVAFMFMPVICGWRPEFDIEW